jgi:hypothetical protein
VLTSVKWLLRVRPGALRLAPLAAGIGRGAAITASSRSILAAANGYWAREYRGAGEEFHFGGRTLSATENVGYFLTSDGSVRSRRKDGEVLRGVGVDRRIAD